MGQTKVVIIGDTQVGKTSILSYLKDGHANLNSPSTIGASFQTHFVQTDTETVSFQIWDTAGQERFRALTPLYYRSALWAILVFDITNLHSFQDLYEWIQDLKEKMETGMNLVLVGNKVDLADKRVVSYSDALNLSTQFSAKFYIETSAATGAGVYQLFQRLAEETIQIEAPKAVTSIPKETAKKSNDKNNCNC